MKTNRIVALLLLQNGWLVQSKSFSRFLRVGNPIDAVKRLSEWGADELVYLDITSKNYSQNFRKDLKSSPHIDILEILRVASRFAFMPMTVGGKINNLSEIESRLSAGADKISINSKVIDNPIFVKESAEEFGSQCIVVSVDIKIHLNRYRVYDHRTNSLVDVDLLEWIKRIQDLGAGEIFLNSVDRDGSKQGMDIELIEMVANTVKIPVVACGGVGKWQDFEEALTKTKVDAVAATNIFHHTDQSVFLAKKYLLDQGLNVRPPELIVID